MEITNLKILKHRAYWKNRVEELRAELLEIADEHGRKHKASLKASKKLDKAILQYMLFDDAWQKIKAESVS